jgi:hypothetical protein
MDKELLEWLKQQERKEKQFENLKRSSSMNIPAINEASQLANQNIGMPPLDMSAAVETAAVPGGQVTEEQYTSFFPYDTTGQMIAARRAEGGIMNAPRQLKQRVL